MTIEFVNGFLLEAMKITLLLSAPMLISGLVAGVLISMFQAATQISEATLVFIPKVLAVGLALIAFFPWMLEIIIEFTQKLIINLPNYIK